MKIASPHMLLTRKEVLHYRNVAGAADFGEGKLRSPGVHGRESNLSQGNSHVVGLRAVEWKVPDFGAFRRRVFLRDRSEYAFAVGRPGQTMAFDESALGCAKLARPSSGQRIRPETP